jgi:hypothetical protein
VHDAIAGRPTPEESPGAIGTPKSVMFGAAALACSGLSAFVIRRRRPRARAVMSRSTPRETKSAGQPTCQS